MKAIVFGASGFIGSHVAEQLVLAGHEVTAIVRSPERNPFLHGLGIQEHCINMMDSEQLQVSIPKDAVVYNCMAYRGVGHTLEDYREVEVELTRKVVEASAQAAAKRYIQLSSIIVYGTHLPSNPIDETYPANPELVIDKASWEREQVVREVDKKRGLDTVILQPTSTIGRRDRGSFFYRIYQAHVQNKFPVIGGGKACLSCVDTRDIGRAMVWLGEANNQVRGETFLLKGYETTWIEIKQELDKARGIIAGTQRLPTGLALLAGTLMEKLMTSPPLDRRVVHALSTNRIYNDQKLRDTGFRPLYRLSDSIKDALVEKSI